MGIDESIKRFKEIGEERRQDLEEFIQEGEMELETIRIPQKHIELPEPEYDPFDRGGIVQEKGDEDGDQEEEDGDEDGDEPGDETAEHKYQEFTPEEWAEMLDEELELNLQPKGKSVREEVEGDYTDYAKTGPRSTLDTEYMFKNALSKKLSRYFDEEYLREVLKVDGVGPRGAYEWGRRNSIPAPLSWYENEYETIPSSERTIYSSIDDIDRDMKIRPNFDDIRKMEYNRDDKRHHYPRIEEKEQQNVVMVNIRDVSGSMREPEQELVFRTFVPINWYIEGKYGHAEMIYIVHDKEAWETDKEDFFRIKSGGGTKISSAFELTKEILEEKYPYNKWNRYIIAASDGENKRDTKENLIPLMKEIQANLQAFVQVNPGANTSSLTPNRKAAKKIADEFDIKRGRKGAKYASVEISSNNHIVDAIKRILDSSGDKKDD